MRRSIEVTASVLQQVLDGKLKIVKAAEKLKLGARQVSRLRDRFKAEGIEGLKRRSASRQRRGYSLEFTDHVIFLVRKRYRDFGPTLAAEKLAERDGIKVSREWLRQVMIEAGIWTDRKARRPRLHQLREPCEQRGTLVQIDGSHHRWFEDRAPKCVLLVYIDDGTSEVGHLQFAE